MTFQKKYPKLIRWIFLTSGIEFFIFGIIDPLYSLFVYHIVEDYLWVGIIFGIRSAIGLLSLFFCTRLLPHLPPIQGLFFAQVFVLLGLLTFFFAGITESLLILIAGAMINGVAYMIRQNAKQGMLMNEVTGANASQIMGTNVAVKYTFWSVGMFAGGLFIFLIGDFPLPFIYLATSGLWVLGMMLFLPYFPKFIALPWKKLWKSSTEVIQKDKLFLHLFSKMKDFSSPLNYSIVLCFFMEMTSRVSLLFIPLLAQSLGLSLWQIFILTALMLFPMVFTFLFSEIADRYDRLVLIIYGIAFSLFPLIFLSFTQSPLYIAISSSVVSLSTALLQPAVLGLSGNLAPRKEKHTVVQLELFFTSIGAILGGVVLGWIAEEFGIQMAFLGVACTAFVFLCMAIVLHFHLHSHEEKHKKNIPKTAHRKAIELSHFHLRRHLG